MTSRTLQELVVGTKDDALSLISEWIAKGNKSCKQFEKKDKTNFRDVSHTLVPVEKDSNDGADELLKLQVTTRSPMGAMAFHFRVLFAYNGLVRLLGAGLQKKENSSSSSSSRRSIFNWTQQCKKTGFLPEGSLLIGDDVFGGFFALNGGAFPQADIGHVCYLPPDDIECGIGLGYSDFFSGWLMDAERVCDFYSSWLFKNWFSILKNDTDKLDRDSDRAYSFFPPLFSENVEQDGTDACARKAVPIEESWGIRFVFYKKNNSGTEKKTEVTTKKQVVEKKKTKEINTQKKKPKKTPTKKQTATKKKIVGKGSKKPK
jgi:hypothetical protein